MKHIYATKSDLNNMFDKDISNSLYRLITNRLNHTERIRVFTKYMCNGREQERMNDEKGYRITSIIKLIKAFKPYYTRVAIWTSDKENILIKLKMFKDCDYEK